MDRPAHGGSDWYEWAHDWLHFVGRSQYSLQIIIPTRMYSDLPSNSQNTCTGPPMCVSGFYELAAAVASSSHLFHPTCNANVQYIYCVCMVILYIWHSIPHRFWNRITSQMLNFISAEMQNLVVWGRLVLKSHTVPAEMKKSGIARVLK